MADERPLWDSGYADDTERELSQQLAEARQALAHKGGSWLPTWDQLTDHERDMSMLDARNYLRAGRHIFERATGAGVLRNRVIAAPEDGPRPLSALRETGLLWLINRTTFHPRGFALALHIAEDGTTEGWSLQGDGTEPWSFTPDCEGTHFRLAMRTLHAAAADPETEAATAVREGCVDHTPTPNPDCEDCTR